MRTMQYRRFASSTEGGHQILYAQCRCTVYSLLGSQTQQHAYVSLKNGFCTSKSNSTHSAGQIVLECTGASQPRHALAACIQHTRVTLRPVCISSWLRLHVRKDSPPSIKAVFSWPVTAKSSSSSCSRTPARSCASASCARSSAGILGLSAGAMSSSFSFCALPGATAAGYWPRYNADHNTKEPKHLRRSTLVPHFE